jgi:type IV pilus assembly protein PilC
MSRATKQKKVKTTERGVSLAKQKMVFYNGKKTTPMTMSQSLRTLAMILRVGEAEARALEVVGHEFRKFTVGKAYLRAADAMRRQGATFKQVLMAEDVFPRTVRELVGAAPTSKDLQVSLIRAAKIIQQSQNVKKKLLTALIQPGFMTALCLVLLYFASAFIIPGLITSFSTLNAEVPPMVTGVLVAAEVVKYVMGTVIIIAVLGSGFWFGYGRRNIKVVRFFDSMAIRMPVVGPIIQLSAASRMFDLLSANLVTGRGEPISLESAGAGCGNEAMAWAAKQHAERMRTGESTLTQFADSYLYPDNARYMLASAPSVKQQIDIMAELAPEYREEADQRLEVFSKTVEPLVNYMVYGVAGVLIIAVVLPMYAMFPALMSFDDTGGVGTTDVPTDVIPPG